MSRILYTNGLRKVDWASDVIRILLERETSTYSPNIDDDFLDAFTGGGGVEISVASYLRQTLGTPAIVIDDTKDQVEYDSADPAFGSLESGQTVKAIIGYIQTGGSDATPADDVLLFYDDGKIDVVLAADALLSASTLWVQPLEANLPNGTNIDFGGGKTATLTSAASRGDRKLLTTNLAAAAVAGNVSSGVVTDSILPAILQNGPFNIQVAADGWILQTQRGLFAT